MKKFRDSTIPLFRNLLIALCAVSAVSARNVDLSTVPNRDTVQLTIYNSEDLTLVRETRLITFNTGINPLQFSWANTLIDPSSVELNFLTSPDKLEIIDTTFPHDKPEQLTWNVASEINGEARVEITYFTSGISWSADYVLIADPDEETLTFDGYVRVTNNSGEDYENAGVRLVVGKINLVEKIAELAMRAKQKSELSKSAAKMVMRGSLAAPAPAAMAAEVRRLDGSFDTFAGGVMLFDAEEKIITKESLSEYFIFTIPGTETVPNGWSKRMRAIEAENVPFAIKYRYRPAEYGDKLVRIWSLTNDAESKLGESPIPDGAVRVFRQNGRDGLAFLATMNTKYVPAGDKLELNLGADPEVIFELLKLRVSRDNIWLKLVGMDTYHKADAPGVDIDMRSTVEGWDEHGFFNQRVRNFTAKPIDVEVRRTYSGDNDFISKIPGAKNHDNYTAEFSFNVPPGASSDNLFEILTRKGRNTKQNRLTVVN